MQLTIKIIIVLLLICMLMSLSAGLFYLVRGKGNSQRLFFSLSFRVGLAFTTFLLLFIAFTMGWLQPHGLLPIYRH